MVRFFLCIGVGLFAGAILGFVTPIGLWLLHVLRNPGGDGGVGTVFAVMLMLTVPGFAAVGVIGGALYGAFSD